MKKIKYRMRFCTTQKINIFISLQNLKIAMKCLITECVDFIGFTLCTRLSHHGHNLIDLDDFNHYYVIYES